MVGILGKYHSSYNSHILATTGAPLTPASPGRWFVAHQLKLLLAYVALNYDVQPLKKRPLNRIFGESIVPSQSGTISVRMRKRRGNSETTS